jgi:hypothetical protein
MALIKWSYQNKKYVQGILGNKYASGVAVGPVIVTTGHLYHHHTQCQYPLVTVIATTQVNLE